MPWSAGPSSRWGLQAGLLRLAGPMGSLAPTAPLLRWTVGRLPVAAQNGGLRGRVVDPSGEPVAGARVTLSFLGGVNRTISVESDKQGNFVRMGIRLGEYRLELTREGFEPYEETVRIRPGPPTRIGEIALRPLVPAPAATAPTGSASLRDGQEALQAEDYEAAAAAFAAETAERPESSEAHRLLGVALRLAGRGDEARAALERAAELDPGSAAAWTALADLEAGVQAWAATVAALETALELDAASRDLRFRLGGALMNAGKFDRAAEVLAALPDDAAAHYQLGMIALNRGENEEAIAHLERVLALDPEGPTAAQARNILTALRPQ